ncbi:hypothetical protein BX600DRAFT_434914 [Xylariales sp. PMI_506]|nr:hypothetical protein BX600DRAFT_434914 [Xylariales sp. PMI_506]
MRAFAAVTTGALWCGTLLGGLSSAQITTSPYTDSATGIRFLGFADGTGFSFGLALPPSPGTDAIIQLVSPVSDSGAGWGGVDFGPQMTGRLMMVAWPDGDRVQVSPRIATGYELDDGADAYTREAITVSAIAVGTFVNSTHVSATFVCGGCLNADSFTSADAKPTFSYAYADKSAVADPSNPDTQLSDHTADGTPYNAFELTLSQAESADYDSWVKLASGTTAGNGTASSDSGAAAASSSSTAQSSSSSSTAESSTSSSVAETDIVQGSTSMGAGYWLMMTMVVLTYCVQPFLN